MRKYSLPLTWGDYVMIVLGVIGIIISVIYVVSEIRWQMKVDQIHRKDSIKH